MELSIPNHRRWTLLLLFAFLATLWNYQFGLLDHQEHLPLLLRRLDPSYLPNDFFLNANEQGFDPRYYFSWLVIAFHSLFSLPFTYLLLTFLGNVAVGGASYAAARLLFWNSDRAGLWAAAGVLAIPTAELGSVAELSVAYLTPNSLAFALVLWAWVFVWLSRWLGAGVLLGMASLLHPLVGPECGALFFAIGFVQLFAAHRFAWAAYRSWALGIAVWIAVSALQLLPYFLNMDSAGDLADADFIRLYAHFRNPHHILPSRFLDAAEREKGLFLLALFALGWWLWWRSAAHQRARQYQVLMLVSALLFLAFLGWLLVEIYPMRLFVTAQTFRLLYLLKWITLVLALGFAAHLSESPYRADRATGWGMLLSAFSWQNLVYLMPMGVEVKNNKLFKLIEMSLLAVFVGYGLYESYMSLNQGADFYSWMAFVALLALAAVLPRGVWLPGIGLCLFVVMYWLQHPRSEAKTPLQRALSRQYALTDLQRDWLEVAQAIRQFTPPDKPLLTPPMHSQLRYLADRALVIDFKTYPFKGAAMLEWQQRLFEVYGWTDLQGFAAVQYAFEPHYAQLSDSTLLQLQQRYDFDYALLWKQRPTNLPVVYENAGYRLVRVEN